MNQRLIGILLIVLGVAVMVFTVLAKQQADEHARSMMVDAGTCFTPEGVCLHEQSNKVFLFGWVPSVALLILGAYLLFFDRSYALLVEQQRSFKEELEAARRKDEFSAFLAGFTPEEQSIIKAVRDQEGIKQSTLRLRVGMSKAMLSIMLDSLEKRDVVAKRKAGKTNQVFLRQKF